ncbi:hypothetical protein B0O99DRAFT_623957 [Bisporella sp. PMI_857]|nr:hypothetical protein B0O99DRAFT_623957 [Bisporella sp. PMI_857]
MPLRKSPPCPHTSLLFEPSSHATDAGYTQPDERTRRMATVLSFKTRPLIDVPNFPAPLVLPGDELAHDPNYPAQSVRDWASEKDRNPVTKQRRTVYLVGPPEVEDELKFVEQWAYPRERGEMRKEEAARDPETEDILGYLAAFYHGLPVKMLPTRPSFVSAEEPEEPPLTKKKKTGKTAPKRRKKETSPTLWFSTGSAVSEELIGIRTRATPEGEFTHQLNLNDLLDAAIEMLPENAYALLMLVKHDIYEDEDDDFACGRAYGGSRIAVVSSARYRPDLDTVQRVDREHGWPTSHCLSYVKGVAGQGPEKDGKPSVDKPAAGSEDNKPMYAALQAHASLPSLDDEPSAAALYGLWLARVSRTAAHELGHCFGIDHCVYYACCMQGTASVAEDARQPPYLCPVDLMKVSRAIVEMRHTVVDGPERDKAMLDFLEEERWKEVHLWRAYAAWLRVMTEESQEERGEI